MAPIVHHLIIIVNLVHFCTIIVVGKTKSNTMMSLNFSSVYVFGDSTVDTGNNNFKITPARANYYPYGIDFPGHIPTGRFSNGKLIPDLIASAINIKDAVPPFLDPFLSNEELITGVSFASGGSGIDNITSTPLGTLSLSNQVDLFKVYIGKLKKIVGESEAKRIIANALVLISTGSNDFVFNFYDVPTRIRRFTIDKYQDFLLDTFQIVIKDLYDLGIRNIGISGLPPLGCLPFQLTVNFKIDRRCIASQNLESQIFNRKLQQRILHLNATLPGSKILYADLYSIIMDQVTQPEKYGFLITHVGCCGFGIGVFESSPFCNSLAPICVDTAKYVFFDSFHASEMSIRYVAKEFIAKVLPMFLS